MPSSQKPSLNHDHELTFLILAYNEESGLGPTVREVLKLQDDNHFRSRVLILDDGSTDQTAAVSQELQAHDDRVDVYRHSENVGQFKNIMKGIELCHTRYFTLIAGDGQIDVSGFERFLPYIGDYDIIFGFPNNEYVRGKLRTFLSHCWRLYLLVLYGVSVTYLAGWIVAPKDLVRRIPVLYGGFLGWYEMAVKLILCGASYMQVPFEMRPRQGGTTKALRPTRNLADLFRMLNVWRRSKGPGVLPEGRDFRRLTEIYKEYVADREPAESPPGQPLEKNSSSTPVPIGGRP